TRFRPWQDHEQRSRTQGRPQRRSQPSAFERAQLKRLESEILFRTFLARGSADEPREASWSAALTRSFGRRTGAAHGCVQTLVICSDSPKSSCPASLSAKSPQTPGSLVGE